MTLTNIILHLYGRQAAAVSCHVRQQLTDQLNPFDLKENNVCTPAHLPNQLTQENRALSVLRK